MVFDSSSINLVVFLVSTHEFDEDSASSKDNGRNQPIAVATDIKNVPKITNVVYRI